MGSSYAYLRKRIVPLEEANVPIMTHAFLYGTAVFEGIRGYAANGNLYIFRLQDHMERLHRSASVYSFSVNYSAKELCKATVELLKKNKTRESCYIRPLTFVGMHGIDLNVTKDSPAHTVIITFPFAKYFKGEVAFWNEIMKHGTYDEFWKARNLRPHLRNIKPAVMTVGGWFDAENLFGALETYRQVETASPDATNVLVMGPWLRRGDGSEG